MDESRVLRMPNSTSVFVFVPPKPPKRDGDYKLDFPPGDPPDFHWAGSVKNYWSVLIEITEDTSKLGTEMREWLQSIEPQVRQMMDY